MRINPTKHIFTAIFRSNAWGNQESVSGPGSDIRQTQILIQQLPQFLQKHSIKRLLDIPCGDFNWMNTLNLGGIEYIGADIVKLLIKNNQRTYQQLNIQFLQLDIINQRLPDCDVILCRDCLVHFSLEDIFSALANMTQSSAIWLLTTHFPQKKDNLDIMTGDWRPLNFTLAPFNFPFPLEMLKEHCTEADGAYQDKTLALWKIDDIKQCILDLDAELIKAYKQPQTGIQQQVKLILKYCKPNQQK